MVAIDTNVLVRLIARDNDVQVEIAEKFVESGAWASHLVLAETMWVLETSFRRTPQQIAAAVESLTQQTALTLQDVDVVTAALSRFRADFRVGFSDCLIVEIARKAGHLPVGTFDKAFARSDHVQAL